jgi:deoxyribose-phosphate aldolase
MELIKKEMANMIDHTNLLAFSGEKDIIKVCQEARTFGFFAVCINPTYIRLACELLIDSGVVVCTVVGFPLGASTTKTKIFEATQAVEDGASEIDMMINISELIEGKFDRIKEDIATIVNATKPVQIGLDYPVVTPTHERCALWTLHR